MDADTLILIIVLFATITCGLMAIGNHLHEANFRNWRNGKQESVLLDRAGDLFLNSGILLAAIGCVGFLVFLVVGAIIG